MKNIEEKETWITPKDVEKRLNLSHGTVHKLIKANAFTTMKIGRTIRISEQDFEKFIETYKNKQFNV